MIDFMTKVLYNRGIEILYSRTVRRYSKVVKKGMALRFKEDYANEINFAKALGFEFFQI